MAGLCRISLQSSRMRFSLACLLHVIFLGLMRQNEFNTKRICSTKDAIMVKSIPPVGKAVQKVLKKDEWKDEQKDEQKDEWKWR